MSGAGEEDKKPAEGGAHINLKVKGQVSTPAVSLFLIFFFLVISPVVPLPHHLPRSEVD
jgi:hypothetical protein